MQQISLIGNVIGSPEEAFLQGRKTLRFLVRAENSPTDRARSSFDFTVVTGRLSLQESLSPGTQVYVSGLLSLSADAKPAATVQALVTHIIEPRGKSAEEAAMEMLSGGIPLQGI